MMKRRHFMGAVGTSLALGLGQVSSRSIAAHHATPTMFFKLSLAQWSLHRQLRSGALDVLDFPAKASQVFEIQAVEYVSQFFKDKARDLGFLGEMKTRASHHGVDSLLIMIDGEGHLGDPVQSVRSQAVENHYRWVEAAQFLGCHSIRVNVTGSQGASRDEVQRAGVDGLSQLARFAQDYGLNVIVENHFGYAENGRWLSDLLAQVDLENCGSLPDFGNFGDYDRYQGVADLLPYAKGMSAKSYAFDESGNETSTDFARMLRLIEAGGYRGYIGVEFEGPGDEDAGVIATRDLLLRLGRQMAGGK
jgi:sugar phosphate isomerase/epimerase